MNPGITPPRTEALYGIVAEFLVPGQLLAAAAAAREAGYRKLDAYTPYPIDGLAKALGMHWTGVPLITLLSGLVGGSTGYTMQFYSAVHDYPLNVGGRPLHSWPSFVPITFELTVLFAALGAVLGMLLLNGLPRPYHPIFNTPFFETRSPSRFYLCIESADRSFHEGKVRDFLERLQPAAIWEVQS